MKEAALAVASFKLLFNLAITFFEKMNQGFPLPGESRHKADSWEGGCCIGGDAYTAVAVAKKVGTGSWTVYNIFRDHLGTITHLKTGSTVTEYSFDAWGRRRDKDDWTTTLTSEPALFADRGFTGHEYLEDFKLYNMNGRLYDPVVGRFLSPDPYIQDPTATQNYNRYSYCLNNPLKYTDPSGNTWWSKFWNWTAEHGIQFGVNIGPRGPVPNISVPGPGNSRVSIGVNTQTGQVGFGNDAGGFMNFYYPGKDYGSAEQNALDEIARVMAQSGAEWRAQSGVNSLRGSCMDCHGKNGKYFNELAIFRSDFNAAVFAGMLAPIGSIGSLTTSEGFLVGSIGFRTPINLRVGLYASENTFKYGVFKWSTIAPEALGSTNWFGRSMLQITPEMQYTLGTWSTQVIPGGTYIRLGLVGPQSGAGLGTWLQIYAPQGVKFIP